MSTSAPIMTSPAPGARRDVKQFLARWIPSVTAANIGDDSDSRSRPLRAALANFPAPLPQPEPDLWRVIYDGNAVVAAIHASPPWGQAATLWDRRNEPGGAKEPWLAQYLSRCWNVEEIAVHPDYRRWGYGRLLVEEVVAQARSKQVVNLSSYAGSDEAVAFFVSQRWTSLPPRTPLPREAAENLRTLWDPSMNDLGGAWVYRRLGMPGASFGLGKAS